MKAFSRRTIIAILFVLPFLTTASATATIHGVVYEWNTFQPLENVIVEVNSSPVQSMVCKYGAYSFELPQGNYKITASYYENSILTYYAEDFVNITNDGSYVVDMLLFPEYSQSTSLVTTSSSNQNLSTKNVTNNETTNQSSFVTAGSIIIAISLLFFLSIWFRHSKNVQTRNSAERRHTVKPEKIEEKAILTPEPAHFTKPVEYPEIAESQEHLEAMESEESYDSTEFFVVETISTEEASSTDVPKGPIPADLQEILEIIRSYGGRMTQKDLRSKLKYSEGKVSLMLFDLEKRGMIQKFKRGRGNVILLVEHDQ